MKKILLKKRAKGFSLIELMIATLLMAMMGVLILNSISSSVKAKENVEKTSNQFQLARQAITRMAKEISMAYLSKNMDSQDPSYVTQFKGYKDKLYFSAFGNIVRQKDAKQSDQQVLGFFLGKDKNDKPALMRKHKANLNLDVEKEGVDQVLCPNVKKIEFSYFNSRNNKWEETWSVDLLAGSGTRNSDQEGADLRFELPTRIKILLVTENGADGEISWVSESEIFLTKPLDLN